MKRSTGYLPLLSILFGILGLILRRWQLETCFDSLGLPVFGPAFALLTLLSAVVVLWSVVSVRGLRGPSDWVGAVTAVPMPVLYITAVASLASGVLFATSFEFSARSTSVFTYTEYLLPALMLAGCFLMGVGLFFTAKGGTVEPMMVMLPGFSSCFWMIMAFRTHASHPDVPRFGWFMLAVVCVAVAWFRVAGFALNRGRRSSTLRACLLAVFFAVTSLAGGEAPCDMLLLALHALSLTAVAMRLA